MGAHDGVYLCPYWVIIQSRTPPSEDLCQHAQRLDALLGGTGLVENGVFKRPGIMVLGYEW